MIIKVLGSSGAEFPNFNPPAFLVDDVILLDAGTIGSMLDEDAQWKIRHILITHAHLDHIKGIPFLADNIILKNKKHFVTIHAVNEVLQTLKENLLNYKIWPDFTVIPNPDKAVIKLSPIKVDKPFKLDSYEVTAHYVNHAVPATGYVLKTKEGRRLLYTGDTGPTEGLWKETSSPIDCAIIEVSMPNKMRDMAIMTGHLTAGLLKLEIKKMAIVPDKILITHPKPQHLKRILAELKTLKMNNIRMLRDGEIYNL